MTRAFGVIGVLTLALTAVAGCGDGLDGAAGGAACDKTAIEQAVAATGATLSKDGFTCEGDWAAAVADAPGATTTETIIFRNESDAWVPKNSAAVCPKPSPIPAAIYKEACGAS